MRPAAEEHPLQSRERDLGPGARSPCGWSASSASPSRERSREAALSVWLERQLHDERLLLESRHQTLCRTLRETLAIEVPPRALAGERDLAGPAVAPAEADVSTAEVEPKDTSSLCVGFSPVIAGVASSQDTEPAEVVEPRHEARRKISRTCSKEVLRQESPSAATAEDAGALPLRQSLPRRVSSLDSSGKKVKNSLVGGPGERESGLRGVVNSTSFELFFSVLILLSALVMTLEVQWLGVSLERVVKSLPPPSGDDGWPGAADFFLYIEYVFGIFFTVEVAMKIGGLRRQFLSGWNIMDFMIVTQFLIGQMVNVTFPINPMLLRVCRLIRLLRLLKLVHMFEIFDTLALLVGSIKASVGVLLWSTMLLSVIQMICAMFLNSLLTDVMSMPDKDPELQLRLFELFGTFTRSMVTMFEITLGNWVPVCRILSEGVNEWYGLVFIAYKCVVGFAVLKVMTGVFLHETFKVASMDDELMIQSRERTSSRFREKMQKLIRAADPEGVGYINLRQFQDIVEEPRVKPWLQAMEMNIQDSAEVFAFIAGHSFSSEKVQASDDTVISVDDLCRGIGRLKGPAHQVDMLALMAECRDIHGSISEIRKRLDEGLRATTTRPTETI